ncbi:hypothetical protein VCHA53O466_140183 [Vibrio chagasii]|nr:hypothetical protein VCHA53O466_140183 [Vibrio chagasii]
MKKNKLELLKEISREQDSIDVELNKLEDLDYSDEEEERILNEIDERINKVGEDLAAVNKMKNQDGYLFSVVLPFALLFAGIAIHNLTSSDSSSGATPTEVRSCINSITAISQYSGTITQGEFTIDFNLDDTDRAFETAEMMCNRDQEISFSGAINPNGMQLR